MAIQKFPSHKEHDKHSLRKELARVRAELKNAVLPIQGRVRAMNEEAQILDAMHIEHRKARRMKAARRPHQRYYRRRGEAKRQGMTTCGYCQP